MTGTSGEPVEISTRMRPGEWTTEGLAGLVASYQSKLVEMGASSEEIMTEVDTPEDGSAKVNVSWMHAGSHTFADLGRSNPAEAENSRGQGEFIPPDEPTEDSQGLGAVFGDAERSAIDAPPTQRAMDALRNQQIPDVVVHTDPQGNTYVEEAGNRRE